MKQKSMTFEDLDVWKKSARLSADIYKRLRELKEECIKFLSYAKGSCGEVRSQIYIGMEIEYIDMTTGRGWLSEAREISAMLSGLMKTKRSFLQQ